MKSVMPLDEANRAELVAYLDGELDAGQARLWEVRLHTDPALRAEADALRRAWDLLDYLPRPAVSAAFASQTLDRISAVRLTDRSGPWTGRRWALRAAWAAALLAAATLGFVLVRNANPSPAPVVAELPEEKEALVQAPPALENLHEDEYAETVAFLMELDQADVFGDERWE